MRILTALLTVLGLAGPVAAQDNNGKLLLALDEAGFWLEEDYDQRAALRARVAAEGANALFWSERLFALDAEALAEGGVIDALFELGPQLRARGVSITSLEQLQFDAQSYRIQVNGTEYLVRGPEDPVAHSWGLATETFVRIVNDLLPERAKDRFYAIGGGNDGHGMFLPEAAVRYFDALRPAGRPYTPTRQPPLFGMPPG